MRGLSLACLEGNMHVAVYLLDEARGISIPPSPQFLLSSVTSKLDVRKPVVFCDKCYVNMSSEC